LKAIFSETANFMALAAQPDHCAHGDAHVAVTGLADHEGP
jgi:hypothetical protein